MCDLNDMTTHDNDTNQKCVSGFQKKNYIDGLDFKNAKEARTRI